MLLRTAARAVVVWVWCALSAFAAPGGRCCLAPGPVPWLWPAASLSGVPLGLALVRPASSSPVAPGAPVGFPVAVVYLPPRGLSPTDLLGGCAGHLEVGTEPGSWCLLLAPVEAGALGSLSVVPVRGPLMGLSLAGPSGCRLGLRALQWFGVCGPGH